MRCSSCRDHPRVCGEHFLALSTKPDNAGSSPRMRGTPPSAPEVVGGVRDHPRVCGEHIDRIIVIPQDRGSSPRMRGTHIFRSISNDRAGIIPAYAGNTRRDSWNIIAARDHPRVCGEHVKRYRRGHIIQGSSPRMRGTLFLSVIACRPCGIIPAYAGNTRPAFPNRSASWDHPRVCGEHTLNNEYA